MCEIKRVGPLRGGHCEKMCEIKRVRALRWIVKKCAKLRGLGH